MEQAQVPRSEQRALICIGDRPTSEPAIRLAVTVAAAMGMSCVFFHVRGENESVEEGQARLEAASALVPSNHHERKLTAGTVRRRILEELEDPDYRLLVMGLSTRSPEQPISPLSKALANRVRTSMLLIRNPPELMERILACTGGHAASTSAISWGVQIASALNMSVTILHVVSSPPAMYTGLPAVEENLAQVLARENPLSQHLKEAANMASAAQVEAHIELRHGMVSEEILRSCDVKNHDLIVIGAPARRALLGKAFLGSIAPHLLASADCSTLIIRDEPYTPAS